MEENILNDLREAMASAEDYKLLLLPFILMVLDFLTGITHAWATGHLKSYKMRDGLNKKVGEICILLVGYIFTWTINAPKYLMIGLTIYIVIMELISLSENLDKMGVPLPKPLKKALRNAEYKATEGEKKEDKKEGEKNDK
ncbi:MAG: phage holin family protein [Bacteroidaceae bacterium]|nr:phage holin family protein [Bacteroidaceae bacterium]